MYGQGNPPGESHLGPIRFTFQLWTASNQPENITVLASDYFKEDDGLHVHVPTSVIGEAFRAGSNIELVPFKDSVNTDLLPEVIHRTRYQDHDAFIIPYVSGVDDVNTVRHEEEQAANTREK